jgi:hypothetical protein
MGSRIRQLLDLQTLAFVPAAIALSSALWLFADKIASLRISSVVPPRVEATLAAGSCASRARRGNSDALKPQTLSFELPGIAYMESCVLGEVSGFVYGYVVQNLSSSPLTIQWEGPSLSPIVVAPGSEVFSMRITTSPPVTAPSRVLFRATGLARSEMVQTLVPAQ